MISFIDKNKLFSKTDLVKFNDGGYMKLLGKENGYFQMKYYPETQLSSVEPILEKEDIVSYPTFRWFVKMSISIGIIMKNGDIMNCQNQLRFLIKLNIRTANEK